MNKLVILGESHTRHFSYRKNITPVFMGSGKTINLNNVELLNKSIEKSILQIDGGLNFLYVGEPNARLKLANHWTPHWDEIRKGQRIDPKPNTEYINESIDNFKKINLDKIDFIITPTCGYDPVIPSLILFNDLLKQTFGDKVIDIFTPSINGDKVRKEYLSPNWKQDPIHLNSRICNVFLDMLLTKGVIQNIEDYSKLVDYEFGTHLLRDGNYKMSNFGSYILKPENN